MADMKKCHNSHNFENKLHAQYEFTNVLIWDMIKNQVTEPCLAQYKLNEICKAQGRVIPRG